MTGARRKLTMADDADGRICLSRLFTCRRCSRMRGLMVVRMIV